MLGWLPLPRTAQAAAADCAADRIDREVRVRWVIDGDTLLLDGDERLRLIGLNTPELGRDGRPPEPLAVHARERLVKLLAASDQQLGLRYDVDRRDRHGRLLAHAYLADGQSVARILLEQGLAMALAVPENLWNQACYQVAERAARHTRLGLWGRPEYLPLEARQMGRDESGFRLVRGRVTRLERLQGGLRIWLDGRFVGWVRRADLARFGDLERHLGRRIEMRGWVRTWRGRPEMALRHPASIAELESG